MSETTEKRGTWGALAEATIGLGVAFIAALGFATSFTAVRTRMHPTFGRLDWCVPTGFDAGIFVFSAAHIYLTRRRESHWLLRVVPLALTGVTVYMNVASGEKDRTGSIAHGAMVSLYSVAVAVAEHVAKRRMNLARGKEVDGIPLSRYLWDPFRTIALRRRMVLTAETSYRRAAELEKARLYAKGLVRAYWKDPAWKGSVPPLLRREVASGDLPDEVVNAVDQVLASGAGAGWKAYVAAWVSREMAPPLPLPEGGREALPGGASRPPSGHLGEALPGGAGRALPGGGGNPLPGGGRKGVPGGGRKGPSGDSGKALPVAPGKGGAGRSRKGAAGPEPEWDEAAFVAATARRYEEENDGAPLSATYLSKALKQAGHGRRFSAVTDLITTYYQGQPGGMPLKALPGGGGQ